LWVEGSLDGQRIRKSLDTANWEIAAEKLLKMEAGEETQKDCSIAEAVKSFLGDCDLRNLKKGTTVKYRQTLDQLAVYAAGKDITTVRALADLQTLKYFVAVQSDSPRTLGKKIERLRTFLRYCEELAWCTSNPALKIKKPIVQGKPVIPFTAEEYERILAAIGRYPINNNMKKYDYRARVRAFILVLRYTGLRISDVVKLPRAAVNGGHVLLRTLKTGATVHLALPPFVLQALKQMPPSVVEALKQIEDGSPYYFWSGNGELKAAVGGWQRTIARLFKLAKVKGHPHMFRHMLAIELLENGITVEQVAAILGNTPGIVYRHYAPWVPSRQKALDSAVMTVWKKKETLGRRGSQRG
jgi:site-specific recombinase XerD